MGIVNALLTGGILIGKICQAIGGASLKSDSNNAFLVSEDVSAGGVVFFRSNVSGKSISYAYNPNTNSPASVVIPNDDNNGGITYVIAPTEKIPFAEADSPDISPSTVVTTGLTSGNSQNSASLQDPESYFKMSFSGLKLGNIVNVGSFKLRCTTGQLIIVSSQISILALSYMYLNSNKGVEATSTANIPRDKQSVGGVVTGDNETTFTIDFLKLGFNLDGQDIIDGTLTLSISGTNNDILALSKVASTPLHPAELHSLSHYQNMS